MTREEPILRTLIIAIVLALACSAMVSMAVHWLHPIQAAHQLIERNRAIVTTAGLIARDASQGAVTDAFFELDARVWDREASQFTALLAGHTYDHWVQGGDENAVHEQPRYVPVYGVSGRETRIVLPIHGEGMWSTIYGYIGLGSDLNTVTAIIFHRHGETPGIGDRIQNPDWLATWRAKQVYDAAGTVQISVSNEMPRRPAHQIDLISGASVTSEKVGEIVRFWMGPAGYAPLLSRLRDEEVLLDAGR